MSPGAHRSTVLLVCLLATLPIGARGSPPPTSPSGRPQDAGKEVEARGFQRFPDTNGRDVVFTSEGDLWTVPVAGGIARRLTSDAGEERFAHFSPDGSLIAFSGQYGGNTDVFVIPAAGGPPRRLTFHPAPDQVVGWRPDGAVLFRSRRDDPMLNWRLYSISPDGGDPEVLPLTECALASFSPDGRRIAFTRFSLEWHHWKQYQGGWAQDIHVGDLAGLDFKRVTDFKGMDAFPMWHGDRIFFLSDRDGVPNLHSMNPDGGDVRRLTSHAEMEVRWPALGANLIVYQFAYDIWLYNIETGENARIDIRLPSDRARAGERVVDPKEYIESYTLSAEGGRLVLCARGELFSLPAKKGRTVNLTLSQGVRERSPAFSPDGSRIAYLSDETGEEEIRVIPAAGGSARRVTPGSAGYHYPPVWSPDGKWLAYSDRTLSLFLVDAENGTTTPIARSEIWEIHDAVFSPDSRWIAWTEYEPNNNRTIRIRAVSGGATTTATDPMFDSWAPAWDPEGKYLYFLSRRTINPYMGPFEEEFIALNATKPYLLVLQAGTPSPFAPKDESDEGDDANAASEGKKDAAAKKGGAAEDAEGVDVAIDLPGLTERIAEIPVEAGNFVRLTAVAGRVLWQSIPNEGMATLPEDEDEPSKANASLISFDIAGKKSRTLATEIDDYALSPDRKSLVHRSGTTFVVLPSDADDPPADEALAEATVDLSGLDMTIDPVAEWRQIFHEAWRLERDFFWDPDMLGIDWAGVRARYAPLLPRVTTRDELTDLLGEMIAELRTSHEYVWGGDDPGKSPRAVGRLGIDLARGSADGPLRIARVHGPDRWDAERASPLLLPGLGVAPGDYLLAIDGSSPSTIEQTHSLLAGKAGKPVVLTVSSNPDGRDPRRIYIQTMESDHAARYEQWVADKRAYVSERTSGRVGYIYLSDMDLAGLQEFTKQFFPQHDKEALILDVRNNAGGYISSMLLERLYRKLWSFGYTRHARPFRDPPRSFHGHLVALIDQGTGSDGESFAEAFKRLGLGPVIGMRSWGGLVGIGAAPRALVDGGGVTQPEFAHWGFDRRWLVEGEGVLPDTAIDNDPSLTARGLDPQLDLAIQTILARMESEPKKLPDPPVLPKASPAGR